MLFGFFNGLIVNMIEGVYCIVMIVYWCCVCMVGFVVECYCVVMLFDDGVDDVNWLFVVF